MKKKDELLDFLASYGSTDLYNELMGSDLYSFIERNRDKLKKYPGYSDIEKTIPHPKKAVQDTFKDGYTNQPDAYIKDQAEKLELSEQDVRKYLNELDTEEKHSKEIEARKKEVNEWPWYKKMLASDYAKQRYINEPEKSIFSDKGDWYNKGEDVSDLLYGGAGAVADFIPGVGGTVLGPAVRGLRDLQHKGVLPFTEESKYQKDWGTIGDDVGLDLLFNAGTDLAPTMLLRKGERYAGNAEKGWKGTVGDELKKADDYLKAKKQSETIKESTEQFGKGDWKKQYELAGDEIKWEKAVDRLPESPMKQDLMSLKTAPRRDKLEALTQWEVAAAGENSHPYIYVEKSNGEKVLKPYFRTETRPAVVEHYKKVLKGNDEATGLTKTLAGAADAWKTFGERGVKEGKTATGRGSKPKESEKSKFERWSKGYATVEEKKSPEYKVWNEENLKSILGVE